MWGGGGRLKGNQRERTLRWRGRRMGVVAVASVDVVAPVRNAGGAGA